MANVTPEARAGQSLRQLPRCLEHHDGFREAVAALTNQEPATFDGVWGSSCALLAAALSLHNPGPIFIVCPTANEAANIADDLDTFSGHDISLFPALEAESSEQIQRDDAFGDRLRLLKSIVAGHVPKIVVASIQSLLQPVPTRQTVRSSSRMLRVGDIAETQQLGRWLAEHKYHSTSSVELPGEFSLRGGILDLFALDWTTPVRIEFFDDEIESIRRFDLSSQRSIETLDEIELTIIAPHEADSESLADYLPPDAWALHIEPEQIESNASEFLKRVSHPSDFHSHTKIVERLAPLSNATASSLSAGTLGATCHLRIESVERFSGELEEIRNELDRVCQDHDVYVVARVEGEVERLREILRSTQLAAHGRMHVPVGSVHQGFRLVEDRLTILSGDQLFHRGELRRTPRRHLGKAIDSFLDLREGDLVVHLAHGIARFRGLQLLTKDDQTEEHLELEFHGRTKIFVPATKIGLVQKYVGGTKSTPRLAKIGGKLWVRQKKAAESAVSDMAAEMLEVQAERALRPGVALKSDTQWQHEFEGSFPYHETPDQLVSISAIKKDMEIARSMDRLLCGDVGFGKTEVAMRAAFKAVENGYQVAVLAPTTVLVEQHFRSFSERMAEFPLDIAKLSRFCSAKEQRETVKRLAAGSIDIIIGTHRLASKDVKFFNLGLLVIDEEQRFGVEVKERLKSIRSSVDVLTMSATPIPRTLHMSLVGVRDISNLETPPEDRLAVETRVTRFNHELIRNAVLRELNRGGQIYFVHNRVGDIHVVRDKLKYIVPEASICIGHGQMPEGELEKVMASFINGQYDILLATTIIESGLDIPNANTIFIDEAERYGLSDLHQLRGRVGRYKHRAYCYLLVDPHKHLSPSASKRLRAIEEYSEMGAGFAIAMRDLEIRGAGNLLGTEQSGHIAAVGYELYCQLLETAVRNLRKMPPKLSIDIDIDLPLQAYLPPEYVEDRRQRIDLYRRMTRLERFDEIEAFRTELRDRFGAIPDAVETMLEVTELRLFAALWQIDAIYLEDQYMVFRASGVSRLDQLARKFPKQLRLVDANHVYAPLKNVENLRERYLEIAKSILQSAG